MAEIFLTPFQQRVVEALAHYQLRKQEPAKSRDICLEMGLSRINPKVRSACRELESLKIVVDLHAGLARFPHHANSLPIASEWNLTELGWHIYRQI